MYASVGAVSGKIHDLNYGSAHFISYVYPARRASHVPFGFVAGDFVPRIIGAGVPVFISLLGLFCLLLFPFDFLFYISVVHG